MNAAERMGYMQDLRAILGLSVPLVEPQSGELHERAEGGTSYIGSGEINIAISVNAPAPAARLNWLFVTIADEKEEELNKQAERRAYMYASRAYLAGLKLWLT